MAARKSQSKATVEQSPPVRVEIRIGGRIRFADDVYNPLLSAEDDLLKLTGALHPTMVSVEIRPPERFGDDPREGEEVILQVHSGKAIEEPA